MKENIYFIEGCRTPFLKSGTDYLNIMSYQLGQFAISGLLDMTGVDVNEIDQVTLGTVVSNVKTPNVAREAAVTAGLNESTPASTVSQACISANQAIATALNAMRVGQIGMAIAGGTENLSDTPIGYRKEMRNKLFKAQKMKGIGDMAKFAGSLSYKDFIPERPAVAEFLTQRTMGQDCEIMVNNFSVSREEQDAFAARSHQLAAKAYEEGKLDAEMVDVALPPDFKVINRDNGIRGESTAEGLAKLRPAFDRKFGSLTAGNSSFLTDGAAVGLYATEAAVKKNKLTPKARIVDYVFTGQRLDDELLLGPAYALSKLLNRNKMGLKDIDVFEIHEAFAGQVCANLKCLASDQFANERLNEKKALGDIPMDKLNLWGGSLSIGHPFGATGSRLVTTAANRLIAENGKYAVIAACAAGAHGHAMLIEKA